MITPMTLWTFDASSSCARIRYQKHPWTNRLDDKLWKNQVEGLEKLNSGGDTVDIERTLLRRKHGLEARNRT